MSFILIQILITYKIHMYIDDINNIIAVNYVFICILMISLKLVFYCVNLIKILILIMDIL